LSNLPLPAIRVAIIEDDPDFLAELSAAIAGTEGMVLVRSAQNLAEARRMLGEEACDVLLVDLGLPDGCGIDAIPEARRAWPGCAVMVSTTFADETHVIQSIEAGASGYLLKDSPAGRLVADIRCLHAGGSPISPSIARYILQRFQAPREPAPPRSPDPGEGVPPALSPREREVLSLITKGFTYDEIAGMLAISRNTVMTFVRRIYGKLEVRSKVEALQEAQYLNLMDG
jgi:DNA-binding NarL/FixJ family response regulator